MSFLFAFVCGMPASVRHGAASLSWNKTVEHGLCPVYLSVCLPEGLLVVPARNPLQKSHERCVLHPCTGAVGVWVGLVFLALIC